MKKLYNKPQVIIEEFTISQSVASGCTVSAQFNKNNCGIPGKYEDEILFSLGLAGSPCTYKPVGTDNNQNGIDDLDDKYCYHIPTDANRYFGS